MAAELEVIPEEKTEKKAKKEKILIAKLTIKRAMSGVDIFIKSKTLEEFFKGIYGPETAVMMRNTWGQGERYYRGTQTTQHPQTNCDRFSVRFDNIDNNALVNGDDVLNLAFMRTKGIEEGKTFNFKGLYRESDIANIAQAINEALKNLFREYNTPACYEIDLNAEK